MFEDLVFDDLLDDIIVDKDKVRTNKLTQYVAFVLDESGSMSSRAEQAITDFNEQIDVLEKEVKEDIETFVIITKFNQNVEMGKLVSLKDVERLSEDNYHPGGTTALFDAIGLTSIEVAKKYLKDDSDATVLMVIITDGYENSSSKFTQEKLKSLIEELKATERWTFAFMGIGSEKEMFERDAFSVGFDLKNIYVASDTANMTGKYASSTTNYINAKRQGVTCSDNFFDDEETSSSKEIKE